MGGPADLSAHTGGKVLIAVNHTMPDLSVVEISYRAHILHGGVAYEWGQVSFQVDVNIGGTAFSPPSEEKAKQARTAPGIHPSAGDGASPSGKHRQRRKSNGSSSHRRGQGEARGSGEWEEEDGVHNAAVETRDVELKNHFPVAMQLLSLAMEDCQDILEVTSVDPSSESSVALPQAAWEGVHLSFRRSAVVSAAAAPEGRCGGVTGDDSEEPWPPSSAPPAFEPKLAQEQEKLTRARSTTTSRGEGGPGFDKGGEYPSPAYPAEGDSGDDRASLRESVIPTVSTDQRSIAQRALDEFRAAFADATGGSLAEGQQDGGRRGGSRGDSSDGDGGGGGESDGLGQQQQQQQQPSPSSSYGRALPFTCTLRAETNASTHHIPVFVFDGSLHFGLLGDDNEDGFHGDSTGTAGVASKRDGRDFGGGPEFGSGWPRASKASSPTAVAGLPPDSR